MDEAAAEVVLEPDDEDDDDEDVLVVYEAPRPKSKKFKGRRSAPKKRHLCNIFFGKLFLVANINVCYVRSR